MPSRQASGAVVAQIEAIIEPVLSHLLTHEPASITLASKRPNTVTFETVQFPGRSFLEARKFARVLLVLQLAHDALVSGTVLTKRNVFYQNQDLFSEQSQVDTLVDALALTLAISREDLNIVATSKGIVVGSSRIHLKKGADLDLSIGDTGTPIPLSSAIESIDLGQARWMLVVEKDAVFRSLCSTRHWEHSAAGPGIIVTAKGYPDLITREFLHSVHCHSPHLPIWVLADYDVDGLNIARSYRYSVDPTSRNQPTLNPGIQWLGITTAQVLDLASSDPGLLQNDSEQPMDKDDSGGEVPLATGLGSTDCRGPVSQLTARDRKVAVGVLSALSKHAAADLVAEMLMSELQRMLLLGVKCEIQWLDESGNIVDWLDRELSKRLHYV